MPIFLKKIGEIGNHKYSFIFALIFLLICRLIAMHLIPLNDTTEARYAEIARKMLETNNWVTLFHSYGIPFWAKPPLSTWLAAFSMKLFGINEFAVRLPSFLLSMGILGLIWSIAKKRSNANLAWNSVLTLVLSIYFFLNTGAVMTDPALLFCITLCMVSFWRGTVYQEKLWAYLFFVGLGLGLLAKGPIIAVLVGIPVVGWTILCKEIKRVWQNLPWMKGGMIALIIALPWYILAEQRTPGFLNYFIIGEHIGRFLEPSWAGDKYGSAHHAPYGMIWLYAIVGILPWTIIAFAHSPKKTIKSYRENNKLADKQWISYLLFFILIPLVFFTFARNIIYPYVFPALPAFALLYAEIFQSVCLSKVKKQFIILATIFGIGALIIVGLFSYKPEYVTKSQKPIIEAWQKQAPAPGSNLIYWSFKPSFSAQFYTYGKVKTIHDPVNLCSALSNGLDNYIVVRTNSESPIPEIPKTVLRHLTKVNTIKIRKEDYDLYRISKLTC